MMLPLLLSGLVGLAAAQFPPTPEGIKMLKSKFHQNVTISYKEPGICETTPGVKSYAGYVHLPPGTLDDVDGEAQDYPINTFFWFFEARKAPENAPLAIWLNGGPGGSSIMGLLEENGPCFVNEDSKTTRLNPWSWNNEVNLLYIDQPTQVGFSYDTPTNITIHEALDPDLGPGMHMYPADFGDGGILPEAGNYTYRYGTASSQETSHTANTTAHAAHALWHFAQTWFFEFPGYRPADDRVSLWAESYGGHYAPGIFRHFQAQNERIRDGSSAERNARYIHLDTLGIVNGLIDLAVQGESWITFPYNNTRTKTYGIQVFNQSIHDRLLHNWTRPDGCRDLILGCQEALKEHGPLVAKGVKTNATEVCWVFLEECGYNAAMLYQTIPDGKGWYDIGHDRNDPFPAPHMYGYLTEGEVLSSLGVPVNYSESSGAVGKGFGQTFDMILGGFGESIGYLLDNGVKVHMMYGDRDYACNWVGGEKASLAIPYSRSAAFANAGYAPLITPDGVTGMTRQLGNYSFSRVFQAGHEVPAYQPVAAYEIFMRATFNRDIATGLVPVTDALATVGVRDTWHIKNAPPPQPDPICYVLKPETCRPEVWERVADGTARVKDWYVVGGVGDDGDDGDGDDGDDAQSGRPDGQVFEEL
ncbi:serine carboxypeptidase [Colletotrichum tabaci]|uniref:Serine carboxypeptidase n=1 Tax=Colletotrichum tabaci TaxID=1209068 RepID=A0AAV9TWR8_9PEZI